MLLASFTGDRFYLFPDSAAKKAKIRDPAQVLRGHFWKVCANYVDVAVSMTALVEVTILYAAHLQRLDPTGSDWIWLVSPLFVCLFVCFFVLLFVIFLWGGGVRFCFPPPRFPPQR